MTRQVFSWRPQSPGAQLRTSIALLGLATLLSGLSYLFLADSPVCFAPLFAFGLWFIVPRLGSGTDQILLLCLLLLVYTVDDGSNNPWGDIKPLTESLGTALFESFGLNGFEILAILCFGLLAYGSHPSEKINWRQCSLAELLALTLLPLLVASLGGLIGTQSGGEWKVFFIQARYLYLLPIWTFIGFVVLRDKSRLATAFLFLTLIVCAKSLQSVSIYMSNRDTFATAEYVYEHFYSAYAALAMVCMLGYFFRYPNFILRLLNCLGFAVTAIAYALDERRTSYVGLIFGFGCTLLLLPKSFLKVYLRPFIIGCCALAVILGLSWNLPPPFGVLKSFINSFGAETGTEEPSYRDLEDANLLREISKNPLTGMGYGKEFEEFYQMPFIANIYPRYKMNPHNSLLASWCYGGPLMVTALSLVFVIMIAVAGRMIHAEIMQGYRLLGIASMFYFLQYFAYTFGDLGFQIPRNMLLGGLLFGSCFRLLMQKNREAKLAH